MRAFTFPKALMSCSQSTLELKQGSSYARVLRWASDTKTYKSISTATKAAPCVLGVPTHGIKEGNLFEVVGAAGMEELNRDENGLLANGERWYSAILTDANTLSLNDVVSTDFGTYTGSGSIAYYAPYDLTGYTAILEVKDAFSDETALLTLTTANGGIVIDNALGTINIVIEADDIDDFTWSRGVFSLRMINGTTITEILTGTITVEER